MEMQRRVGKDEPESLPGVRKQSFSLPYRNGEIWFEHLDGMYQFSGRALEKLMYDSRVFLLPSKPACIGFVLNETEITDALISRIASLLCQTHKRFARVCFIGADRKTKKKLQRALAGKQPFETAFIDDFECAKEWLIPADRGE